MAEQEGQKKRRRLNPVHRWTEGERTALLEVILEEVKDRAESFEKPTAEKFYNKIKDKSPQLKEINWMIAKSKMRHFKNLYTSATTWKGNTGAGLLASGEEKSVAEYLHKICPDFDILDQIFGQRKHVNPPVIFQTSEDIQNIMESDEDFEMTQSQDSSSPAQNNGPVSIDDLSDSTPEALQHKKLDCTGFKKKVQKQKRQQSSSNNFSVLHSLQERKLDLEIKKFELEELSTKRELELKEMQLRQDFELKKLEIEKTERLHKHELELKHKNN